MKNLCQSPVLLLLYTITCDSLQSHRSSLCVDAHVFATRLADGAEHKLGGMKWIDDECDAYSKDACARAWGHVRK